MGCEGGDAPSTKEPEVWKPAETFERLSQDEKDALFNAPTLPNFAPPRRDTDPDNSLPDDPLDLAGGSSETTPPERPVAPHRDTNTAGGFNVERPDMFAKKYDTLPSEQVKTPTGVLDAAWTAGGRLPGREHIETTHRIEDLEAWADNLAALAEEKVGEARSEKDKTIQQADTLTSNVNFELRQEREANERQKHEAEKAAALALQWKEYSEQVTQPISPAMSPCSCCSHTFVAGEGPGRAAISGCRGGHEGGRGDEGAGIRHRRGGKGQP